MEESKISAAEIEDLREYAEKERQSRHQMQSYIELAKLNGLPAENQMQLIKRGKKDEILALLQVYAEDDDNRKMSADAQLYLYEKGEVGDNAEIYQFLLEKVRHTDKLTKRLIEDRKFCSPSDRFCILRELSPEMQCYFIEHKIFREGCQTAGVVVYIANYFNKYDLCEKAEVYLLEKCLNPEPSRDSFMDGCYKLAEKYITCKRKLSLAGEKTLIASGKHDLILKYIKIAEGGLKAEDELLARGNREEVTAYFERYATL